MMNACHSGVHLKQPGRFEGIDVMGYDGSFFAGRPEDPDHIKSGRMLQQIVTAEVGQSRLADSSLFVGVDRFGWQTRLVGATRFYFDNDHRLLFCRNQVELTVFV